MIDERNADTAMYPFKWFFNDCLWLEDKIIFPDSNCNAICETDIKTGSTRIVCIVNEDEERLLFHGIYKWKEWLILPARNAASGLHLFNLENRKWDCITVEENKKEWINFRGENVFEHNDCLYIFPLALVVLKVDIGKKSIDYIFYPEKEPESDLRGEVAFIGNTVYIPVKHSKKIYKFNLAFEKWEVIEVNTELKGIDTLCYDGRQFWMSGVGKMICSWNEEENVSVSYKNFPRGFCKLETINECAARDKEDGWWFGRSFWYGKSIYFIPGDANMLIVFDTEKKDMKELPIEGEEETRESLGQEGRFSTIKYMVAKQRDNLLMMLSNKNKNLVLLDVDTKKTQITDLKICSETEMERIASSRQMVGEGMINLRVWLKNVISNENQCGIHEPGEAAGKKIYSFNQIRE